MTEDGFYLDGNEMELLVNFLQQEENSAEFTLQADDSGFNPELIEKIFSELRLFISARIMKRWEDEGDSPKTVVIKLSLDIS